MTEILYSSLLSQSRAIRHGFFTRRGGVSRGIYASLNCSFGSRDYAAHVAENRERVRTSLDNQVSGLCTLYQCHSNAVVRVTEPFRTGWFPKADAMITATPGIALGVLGADCAPVLIADCEAKIVGAAHAGGKGARLGVIESVVEGMIRLGAEHGKILACIGPAIQQRSYEVGSEFRRHFLDDTTDNEKFFDASREPDRWRFNLPAYVECCLEAAGIKHVENLGYDTVTEEQTFFSYRRATLAGEPDYGRQISVIALD